MASAPSHSMTTSQAAPPKRAPTPPISIRPAKAARAYSIAHPLVVLGLLGTRFQNLVSDPRAELLGDLPILVVLQLGYVATCLPAAGASPPLIGPTSASGRNTAKFAGYKRKPLSQTHGHPHGQGGISKSLTSALLSLTLAFLLGTPALAILLVLFGAPATTHIPETILCAAHMAILSATGLIYAHGVDGHAWREVWGAALPGDSVWGATLGTAVGAWLGAVPIPLDWDRPWQAYPVTIITGAYIGFMAGSLIGRAPGVFGRRIEFTAEELGAEKED